MDRILCLVLLSICVRTEAAATGLLKIDALSAGGSFLDEVSLLHAVGDSQYIIGQFNGDDKGLLTGVPGRFRVNNQGFSGMPTTSNIEIDSSNGAVLKQQDAPIDAVFVAKARKNLTEMDWLYGPFACEGGKSNPVLNCTQHLNHDSSYLSPVTGAAVVKDELIMSGCRRNPIEPVLNGCADVIKPGKWHLSVKSTQCINTQGGMTVHKDRLFVAGIFAGVLTSTLFDNDENVLNETGGPQSSFQAPFIMELDFSGGIIEWHTRVTSNSGPIFIPLFLAAAPHDMEGNKRVFVLSRSIQGSVNECAPKRITEAFPASATALTDVLFNGQPTVLFHLASDDGIFEPTGIAMDPNSQGNVAYVSGYLRGELRLPNSCFVNTTKAGGLFSHSDGLLIKVDLTKPHVEWVLRVGGPGQDKALGVAALNGAVYVVGTFENGLNVEGLIYGATQNVECDYAKVALNMVEVKSSGGLDIFVLKLLSQDLDIQWVSTATGPKDAYVTSIALDSNGLIHIGGRFEGTLKFPFDGELRSQGLFDAFVATIEEDASLASRHPDPNSVSSKRKGAHAWKVGSTAVLSMVSVIIAGIVVLYILRWHRSKQKVLRSENSSGSLGTHVLQVVASDSHASAYSED